MLLESWNGTIMLMLLCKVVAHIICTGWTYLTPHRGLEECCVVRTFWRRQLDHRKTFWSNKHLQTHFCGEPGAHFKIFGMKKGDIMLINLPNTFQTMYLLHCIQVKCRPTLLYEYTRRTGKKEDGMLDGCWVQTKPELTLNTPTLACLIAWG